MSQEAMNPQTARKLLEVGEAFRIPGPFFSYEEIKMGNVNHTYKVNYIRDDGTGMAKVKSYLVQRVNTYAFQRPVELMKNIDGVTGHIRQKHPGAQYLHFHHTQDGCNYLFDEDGFWRLSNYVPSVTYDSCDDLGVVRSAGEAFGSFQMMLSDFDASSLYYTIPDFHNTRKRYAKLREDMESDPCGRVGAVKAELDWLLSVEERACALTDLYERGELPLRVTHNDTKLNNVLIDNATHRALCVIDLDTVMPGSVLYDFGDAVRYGACTAAEDEPDTARIGFDMALFRAFAEGFLSETADRLTDAELSLLPLGVEVITCELAMRFLTDYLDGDRYFKIRCSDHNLVRARAQMKLLTEVEAHRDEMNACVAELRKTLSHH